MSGGCRGRKAPFEGPHPAEAKASEPVVNGGPQTGRSSGGARPYVVAVPGGGARWSRITAANRLKSYRIARSAFPAVEPLRLPPY